MALFSFFNSDTLPENPPIQSTEVKKVFDIHMLTQLTNLIPDNIEKRFETGNEVWVLFYQGNPVSFGWLTRGIINIGELSKQLVLPDGDAYFWNFRTLEAHRGKGYYPHLLRAMIQHEIKISERLWIIAAPENKSSFNGIIKSGFSPVGVLAFNEQQGVVLSAFKNHERAIEGAKVFQVPLDSSNVRPCWTCYSNTMKITAACECKMHGFACTCGLKKQ